MDPYQPDENSQIPVQPDSDVLEKDRAFLEALDSGKIDVDPAPAQPSATPGYVQQPTINQLPHSGSDTKRVLLIAVAVVLIAIVGAGALLWTNKDNNGISDLIDKLNGKPKTVVGISNGPLDLSRPIDDKAQDKKAKMNQQVDLSDGISYMVTKLEQDLGSRYTYNNDSGDKELVKVSLAVGNRNKLWTFHPFDFFKIKTVDGILYNSEIVLPKDGPEKQVDIGWVTLEPGKQIEGSLFFVVDKDQKISSIVTDKRNTPDSSPKDPTIKSEVTFD